MPAELGLYYYRNRHLDPIQGRFTTRDPIGNWGDGMNLGNGYGYVGNNPWTYVDPMGLEGGSYILSHTPLQDGNSSGWNDPMSMLNGLDSAGYSSRRQLSAAGHQELANTMVNASGVFTAIVAGTIGVNGRTNEASEWQQMGTVIGAEARNEAIGTVTGAGATAVGVGIYQRYFRRPVGNLLSSAWGRVCSLVGRGADDVAQSAASQLIGVPEDAFNRAMARLQAIRVGDNSLVESVEVFGSRAGSTYRGRGPTSTSDLDILLTVSDMKYFNGSHRQSDYTREVLRDILDDFTQDTSIPMRIEIVSSGTRARFLEETIKDSPLLRVSGE